MDDAQLLRRYVEEGSEAAFSDLVARHLSMVHSAAMRHVNGDFHRAKDVTQLVFNLLARKAASLTHHSALTGWLYATTHFVAAPMMRSERRRKIRDEETRNMNELLANPEPEVDWTQLRPIIDGAILELNEDDRETILGRFFDALPIAALGQKLGVSETAAQKRLDRALGKMRVSLAKRGADSTTAALALMLATHGVVAAPAGLAETVTAGALASAAGVGSQAVSLLKFLGKSKLGIGLSGLVWMGGILILPAIGAAAYEFWTARRAQAELASDQEGYRAQLERLWAVKKTVNDPTPSPPQAAASGVAIRDPRVDFQKFLLAYPGARAAVVARQKAQTAKEYGSFFRSAGLTPLQIEQFENAVSENVIRNMTLRPAAFVAAGISLPSEDQLRAILGDAAYREFQSYGESVNAHYLASQIAGRSSAGGSFSAAQLDQLAELLATNTAGPPPRYATASSLLASTDWGAFLPQAQALFSDSQWRAAQPVLLEMQAAGVLAKAQQAENAARDNLSPAP